VSLRLKLVFCCAQVVGELLDVLIQRYYFIILKDNKLFHLLDFPFGFLLLQLVAFEEIHKRVDVVRASTLQVGNNGFSHGYLLPLFLKLKGQLLSIVDQALQILGVGFLPGVECLIVNSYLFVSKESVIKFLLSLVDEVCLVSNFMLLVAH
jgi:hypothetical protein